MAAPLELFVLPWGPYPRRALIYLAEKGLLNSPLIKISAMTFNLTEGMKVPEGKPPGTVPILKLPDGTCIRQSVSILDYFEDILDNPDANQPWQAELANGATNKNSFRGKTAEERARSRDMISIADEICSQFILASRKGSRMFSQMETSNGLAAQLIVESCKKSLKSFDEYYKEEKSLLEDERQMSLADIMIFAMLQFAKEFHGIDLLAEPELPELRRFYNDFAQRPSGKIGEGHYPECVRQLARQWATAE